MKKVFTAIFAILLLSAGILSGCTMNEKSSASTIAPLGAASNIETPTPMPTQAVRQAGITLMDVPEDAKDAFPVPEAYITADVENDLALPYGLGFTLYFFMDKEGNTQYRAFGQNIDKDGKIIDQGWYAVRVISEEITSESVVSLSAGSRVVATDKADKDKIIAGYIIGRDEITADVFEKYAVMKKSLDVDLVNAKPINLNEETLLYSPIAQETQGAEPTDPQPSTNPKPTSSKDNDSDNKAQKPLPIDKKDDASGKENNGKTWHEAVYENVWVVDVPASSYEEPVYETRSASICNTCEADITGNTTAHMKEHALKGENASYREGTVKVQTGTQTVNVPEQGHWEKKLIKETGYY